MKSFSVRLAVLALAFAGFAASTVASVASKHTVNPVVIAGTCPSPMCTPGHGVCGMD